VDIQNIENARNIGRPAEDKIACPIEITCGADSFGEICSACRQEEINFIE